MDHNPQIVERASFKVAGVAARIRRGTESPDRFASVWSTFEARRRQIEPYSIDKYYYGVSIPTDDEVLFEYLAGMAVPVDLAPIKGCEGRIVPGGTFAVFECPIDGIGATYQEIFNVWLPRSSFEFDGTLAPFEEYPGSTAERPVRIHIPVRQRGR